MEDKKVCEKCGVLVSKFAYNRHLKSCTGDPKKFRGGEKSFKKKFVFTGVCQYCGKECKNSNSQRNHELRCKLNSNRILMDGENNPQFGKQPWNKGFSKENNESLKKASLKIISNYKNGKVKHPWLGRKHSEKTKEKISKSMALAHKEKRAWNIGMSRWNNKPSYPEEWFMKVIENEFNDKNYKREFPFAKYSLDFAWEYKKLCIEIDGDQHRRFESYKIRDLEKDKFLKEKGWKVLRISWKDLCNNTKKYILLAKTFVDNGEVYLDNELLKIKLNELKEVCSKKLTKLRKIKKGQVDCNGKVSERILSKEEIKNRNELILNSNIDFSKLGWLSKVSTLLNMSHSYTKRYMEKYLFDFYSEKCYNRKYNKC